MKRTINGIRYDTDKAQMIGFHITEDRDRDNDLEYWRASLYVTPKSGRYFLAGGGSTMTRFNGKHTIIPMSKCEAVIWASQFLDADTVNEHF